MKPFPTLANSHTPPEEILSKNTIFCWQFIGNFHHWAVESKMSMGIQRFNIWIANLNTNTMIKGARVWMCQRVRKCGNCVSVHIDRFHRSLYIHHHYKMYCIYHIIHYTPPLYSIPHYTLVASTACSIYTNIIKKAKSKRSHGKKCTLRLQGNILMFLSDCEANSYQSVPI